MHLLMRNFNKDPISSAKIAKCLIKKGANLEALNSIALTPLHVALYYG
jgi:ankyrin repeat protein